MRVISFVAVNTFKEAIRDRILHGLIFFSVLVLVAAVLLGEMSVNQDVRVLTSLGLGGLSLFSVLISIFIGVNLLYKELDRKTIYTVISKPIRRHVFLVGKYLGMCLTLGVQILAFSLCFALLLSLRGGSLTWNLLSAVYLIFLETMIVSAVAVLFSSFSSPFLSGLFTLGIFICSRLSGDLLLIAQGAKSEVLATSIRVAAAILPDLQDFTILNQLIHDHPVGSSYLLWASAYALAFSGAALALAMVLFNRRDFV